MPNNRDILFQLVIGLHIITQGSGASSRLPTSTSFLFAECENYRLKYNPIVAGLLAKHRNKGLLVSDILTLHGWEGNPQVIVVNNTVLTVGVPHLNVAAYLIPMLTGLASKVRLPDLVLAGDIMDQPEDDISRHGGPWFGYCNIMFQTTNVIYPAGGALEKSLTCGSRYACMEHSASG